MLQNLLNVADLLHHGQGAGQPVDSMLVAMPPNQVAVGLDLRAAFLAEAPSDVSPGQEYNDHIFVHRFVWYDHT